MGKKIKNKWHEEWIQIAPELVTKGRNYFFSNYGRLKSVAKIDGGENLLKAGTLVRGHKVTTIKFKDSITKTFHVQKLVAEAFCKKESEDEKNFIIHIDGNLNNNQHLNLKFVTRENLTENFKKRGVWDPTKRKKNPGAKMNPYRVRLLRERLKAGKTKKKILAKSFGISVEQVRKIEKGIDWAWVKTNKD
jgi:hypothetical protein